MVTAPRARSSGSVLLTSGRVTTMNGDEVLESGDILVTDNRIAAVRPRGKVPAAAGIRRIVRQWIVLVGHGAGEEAGAAVAILDS